MIKYKTAIIETTNSLVAKYAVCNLCSRTFEQDIAYAVVMLEKCAKKHYD